jgi:hypothetical protein
MEKPPPRHGAGEAPHHGLDFWKFRHGESSMPNAALRQWNC